MSLIKCEGSLILTWAKSCILISKAYRKAVAAQGGNTTVAAINNLTSATFAITDCKLHVPVITLSAENDNKHLEKLKTGFKRTIKWNKYRSEMRIQAKNNNINYLIDPTFTKLDRLFVLSYENEEDRTSFSKY